jgi:hypothetical protein
MRFYHSKLNFYHYWSWLKNIFHLISRHFITHINPLYPFAECEGCLLVERLMKMNKRKIKTCWKPVITEYMGRMMQGGYPERYRRNILFRAFGILDRKLKDDRSGVRPLYRPKDYDLANRRRKKQHNKYSWSNKGNF